MSKIDRINRTVVRGLARGEKATARGIVAERLKDGDVRYSVQIMVDGERIARVIGRESEGVTPTQCEQFIETTRAKAREGRLSLPQGRKLHMGFSEAARKYLERLEDEGGKDLNHKRRNLENHLMPYFKDQRIDQLKEFAIKQYRKQKLAAGLRDASINRHMSTLRHMLNRASSKSWGWMTADKKPEIEFAAEPRKPIRILSPEQCDKLLHAAMADEDPYVGLFVAFGLGASMRHMEILRRRYDEVDFVSNRLWINKAKAGERQQPITKSLAEAIKRQRELEPEGGRDGYMFPARHARAKFPYRATMRRPFERAVRRAGLDPRLVTPHVMRHTAITRLVKARVDLPTIQKISGHKTLAMVIRYTHVHGQHIDDAIELLDMPVASRAITDELPVADTLCRNGPSHVVAFSQVKRAT